MSHANSLEPEPERRSFLKWVIHGLSAVLTVAIGAPAVAYIIDPRNRPVPEKDFRTVDGVRVSELKPRIPQQGVISDIRSDAWTLYPNDVVGQVWVVKDDKEKISVFTTVCPHLGCSINLTLPAGFTCPCHGARFDLTGAIPQEGNHNNPAPRPMDALEWRILESNPDLIQVKYQRFYQGRAEKEPMK